MNHFSRAWVAIRIVLVGCAFAGANQAQASEGAVKAIWQVQEIYFPYQGFTTYYSCDGLRDKTQEILERLGAREDLLVSVAGCESLSGPSRMPSLRISIANPIEATDAAIAAQAQDGKRAERLAKMQRKSKATVNDEPFMADRKTVALPSKDFRGGAVAGDCELLEQIGRRVVPALGGKVIKDELRCVPHQGTVGNPQLTVEVLVKQVERE